MPRPTQAQGRPGTQVIPTNWGPNHGVVAAKTMDVPVSLRHPGTTLVYDDSLGYSVATPLAAYFTGSARIQAQRETALDNAQNQAEESIRVTGYLVTLPLDSEPTDIATGDLIDIDAAYTTDPALTGITLRVVEVTRSSLRFERDLYAVVHDPAETR